MKIWQLPKNAGKGRILEALGEARQAGYREGFNSGLIAQEDAIIKKYIPEIIAWQQSKPRKSANIKWTASLYRQIGYLIETEHSVGYKEGFLAGQKDDSYTAKAIYGDIVRKEAVKEFVKKLEKLTSEYSKGCDNPMCIYGDEAEVAYHNLKKEYWIE